MRSQLPSAPSLKSMGRRRDEGPPPALRGTSPSPSEGGEPPTGHSLIWLDKLFFLLSSPYLLKSLMLSVQQSQLICSTSPPYLLKSPTLSVQHPHLIYYIGTLLQHLSLCHSVLKKTSVYICHYVIMSKKEYLSLFVTMSLCFKENIPQHLSLCHYVLKKTSVSICHYVILS